MLDWKKHKLESRLLGRNINNLRYADDTTLMAESEEELKSLLMKVKLESEKVGLKLNIQKMKIMASGPTTPWEINGQTVKTVSDFIFLCSKITTDGDCSHQIKSYSEAKFPVFYSLWCMLGIHSESESCYLSSFSGITSYLSGGIGNIILHLYASIFSPVNCE